MQKPEYRIVAKRSYSASAEHEEQEQEDEMADFIDSTGFPTTANIGDGRITSLSGALAVRPTEALTFELGAVYNHSRVDDLALQILPIFDAAPARLGCDGRHGRREDEHA